MSFEASLFGDRDRISPIRAAFSASQTLITLLPKTDFVQRTSLFIVTVVGLNREEFGQEAPRRHFSKANVVESGPTKSLKVSASGDALSIVAPFASQAAITIEHTYVAALSPSQGLQYS